MLLFPRGRAREAPRVPGRQPSARAKGAASSEVSGAAARGAGGRRFPLRGQVARVNSSPDLGPAPGWRLRPTPGRPPPPSRSHLRPGGSREQPLQAQGAVWPRRGRGGGLWEAAAPSWPRRRAGRARGSERRKPPRLPGRPDHRWIWRGHAKNVRLDARESVRGTRAPAGGTRGENPPGGSRGAASTRGNSCSGLTPGPFGGAGVPATQRASARFSL